MKRAWIAVIGVMACAGLVFACSGASESEALDGNGSSSGSSSTSSGGEPCPFCPAPPGPGCTPVARCSCTYACPDGAAGDASGGGCIWSADGDSCGPGRYCSSPTCGQGTCVALGATEALTKVPVCGCDGVTYWNDSVAAKNGMSIRKTGVCDDGRVSCGGVVGAKCPKNATCSKKVQNVSGCGAAGPSECWVTPAECPKIVVGVRTRSCGASTCSDECTITKQGGLWYEDNLCPQ